MNGGLIMKVLIIGQGGREHALVRSVKKSAKVEQVYCAPGNGGIEKDAICLAIKELDFEGLATAVEQYGIDLTIVGPEQPLINGIVDYFQAKNLPIIGPTKIGAQMEGSKAFAKELMKRYQIPTAKYEVFEDKKAALNYVHQIGVPIVIKADGLAAGKGVVVALEIEEALQAIHNMMEEQQFGEAGRKVVIEEFLQGEELTVLSFVDGSTVIPMQPAQDHKPVFDGDKGPNTGGMGAYSPVPHIKMELLDQILVDIIQPTVNALVKEGIHYRGILYTGLMLTENGPKVIEYNARFGDPETQVILPRLETDLIDVFMAMNDSRLNTVDLKWKEQSAVCVVMSSEGYPLDYEKGKHIFFEELPVGTDVFIAGAVNRGGSLVTSGGRVLSVTALEKDITKAKELAYAGIDCISFTGAHYRTDIADKAIAKMVTK